MMAFLLHGVPVTHLDNNKILALNIQGANARLPPAPDQDTRSLACWSVLACWRPLGTLVEASWAAQSSQTVLYSLLCSALWSQFRFLHSRWLQNDLKFEPKLALNLV